MLLWEFPEREVLAAPAGMESSGQSSGSVVAKLTTGLSDLADSVPCFFVIAAEPSREMQALLRG